MIARLPAFLGLSLLVLPLLGLVGSLQPAVLAEQLTRPSTWSALGLSLRTTGLTLALTLLLGTPLAWTLARSEARWTRLALVFVELPVVLPPAVLGVALLETFGRSGWLGPLLGSLGLRLPFTPAAVVLAQLLVGAPLYILAATTAFRAVDEDLLLVARTLGASPWTAWRRVALPVALPGLLSGAGLAWARALGEFGATLMFAGSLPGHTTTLPLAIYSALESDVDQARALSVLLVGVALGLLAGLRLLGRSVG